MKDFNALLKKSGSDRYFTAWASLSGAREYVNVRYISKLSELDTPLDPKLKDVAGQAAAIGARIGQCIESSERFIDDVEADLSFPRIPEPPKMVRVLRTVVKPDKVDEYRSLIKAEIAPAMKKAGVKTWTTARTRFGGPRSEFRSAIGLDSWADLDGQAPLVKAMGEQAYRGFLAKVSALIVESEVNIYRYAPDLSYLPSAAPTSSGN